MFYDVLCFDYYYYFLSVMYNTADIDNVPCFRSFAVCEVLYGSPQYDVHSRGKFHQKLECIVCRLPFGPRHLQKVMPRAQTCLGEIREGFKSTGLSNCPFPMFATFSQHEVMKSVSFCPFLVFLMKKLQHSRSSN